MPRSRIVAILVTLVLMASLNSAWAFIVTDPALTARNAVTAVLRGQILDTAAEQGRRIRRMARRLSETTNLDRYAVPDAPRWRIYRYQDSNLHSNAYSEALNYGDPGGRAFEDVARKRLPAGGNLSALPPGAAAAIAAQLATLDLADSTIIVGTDQNGRLRPHGKQEMRAIDALEHDVLDPSQTQSTTAVLDKISAAVLIETQQKQSRLQFLTALVEQLMVDSKRARDTEAAAMNMQLRRLQAFGDYEGGGGFLAGAGADLRAWRQP